eukprot:scaffold56279_cov18-Tisochrysis_lutea.AAC.1
MPCLHEIVPDVHSMLPVACPCVHEIVLGSHSMLPVACRCVHKIMLNYTACCLLPASFEKKNAGLYQNITFPEACRASASIKHGLIARHVDWKPCAFGIC